MSNYDEKGVKPSGEKLPRTDASCIPSNIGDQIVRIGTDLASIKEEVSELKKDKTPYGVIMKSPVIFVCGLFFGALIAGYLLYGEKQERKELKQELIEYTDKMITKARTSE